MVEPGEKVWPIRAARPHAAWASDRLLTAAQRGDVESISAVVSGAHPHVTGFARSLCASPQDAEDAAQEAMLILYRKMGSSRASAALASWMFRIVRNECLRLSRRLPLGRGHDRVETSEVESAEDHVMRQLEADRVATLLAALPQVQRRVLIIRDVQGLPGRMVADQLGLSVAAMKSHLHRGRLAVQVGLGEVQDGGPEGHR